jgi:hypothetical protein
VKFVLLIFILSLQSCLYFFGSDYDVTIDKVRKLKIAEKKAGKKNPIYDGVVEPDFPDGGENDKTYEGVDSNHDGVRDDVEIWINRTADDQYIRLQLKDYYKAVLASHLILLDKNESVEKKNKLYQIDSEKMYCFFVLLNPYKDLYVRKKIDVQIYYSQTLEKLIFNTRLRKELVSLYDHFPYASFVTNGTDDFSECSGKIPGSYFKKIRDDAILKNK